MHSVRSSGRISAEQGVGVCTWSQGMYLVQGGCTWSGGVPGPGGCPWSGGYLSGGVYLVWGVYLVQGAVHLVPGSVPGPGGYLVRGAPGHGGCTWSRGGGESVPGGCTWSGTPSPPPGQTHACKNITFATSLRTV